MGLLEVRRKSQRDILLTGFILTIALFLRFYQLGQECLWIDEVSSVDQALRPLPELFSGFLRGPLYYFLLHLWIKLFGLSEFSLRFPSAIFGITSVYLTYRIGKTMFNRFVGQVSALLLAVSPFHIFFSQEVRHYSLWVFLTLLSNFIFLKLLKNKDNPKNYIYYCLAMTASLYTILWSVLSWAVHNLVIIFGKRANRRWFISQVVIFVGFLFWLIPFMLFVYKIKDAVPTWELGWILPVSWLSLAAFFKTILCTGIYFGASAAKHIQISFLQAAQIYLFFILFLLGLGAAKITKTKNLFLAAWLFLPFGIILMASFMFFPLFSERYFIFVLPAFFIVTALGVFRFKKKLIRSLLIIVISVMNLPALWYYYGEDQKPHYDRAVKIIKKAAESETDIVINPPGDALVFVYYFEKNQKDNDDFHIEIRRKIGYKMLAGGIVYKGKGYRLVIAKDEKRIRKFVDNGLLFSFPNIWLVSRPDNGIKDFLSADFGVPEAYNVGKLKLYHFKNRFHKSEG